VKSSDQHAVAHDLGLQPGGSVRVPDRLATVEDHDLDADLAHADPGDVRGYATLAERVDDPVGTVLVHRIKVARPAGCLLWVPISPTRRTLGLISLRERREIVRQARTPRR
jgi:hypothetical protein